MKSDLWQGYCGYWQNSFIGKNFLLIGHKAWEEFMTKGRGLVICNVGIVEDESVDWKTEITDHTVDFVPLSNIPAYLQAFNLEVTIIQNIIDRIFTYDPIQQIPLLINENGQIEIHMLQNLAISTIDCYQQIERRWSEFQLDSPTHGECNE